MPRIYWSAEDGDLDFNGASADPGVRRRRVASWRREIGARPGVVDGVRVDLGRDSVPRGDVVEVRDIVVHMIEEYARHCGHADLLRECIDGRTGQ